MTAAQQVSVLTSGEGADKVMETTNPSQVSEVQSVPSSNSNSDHSFILAEIAKLSLKIREMEKSRNFNRYKSRSRSASRSRNMTRRTPSHPDWLCVYHYKYRHRARKCIEPCAWKKPILNQEN